VSVAQQKKESVIAGLTRNRLIINSVFCSDCRSSPQWHIDVGLCNKHF